MWAEEMDALLTGWLPRRPARGVLKSGKEWMPLIEHPWGGHVCVGGCYRLSSLGDRLRDGDLWVRTVFGGVLGTDTWGGGKQRRHRRRLAVVDALTTRPILRSFGDGPSALPWANWSLITPCRGTMTWGWAAAWFLERGSVAPSVDDLLSRCGGLSSSRGRLLGACLALGFREQDGGK